MVQTAHPALARSPVAWQRVGARLRSRVETTPGRMRLASLAIVVGLLTLAVVGAGAVGARQRAAQAVGQQAEPLLLGAEVIYTSLADADATATNTYLKAGLEPPDRRQAYLHDLEVAANEVATVARQAGSSQDAATALSVINKDLPMYSGLVESARANNRLALPVGAAYLRQASDLMQSKILPAVKQLYQVEAARLNRANGSGRSALDLIAVVLVAAVALAALVVSQLFVARRTNRVLNPALLVASLLTVVLLLWTVLALVSSANRLKEAQSRGSDPVQLLSSSRILVSRAQVDENLSLVARGGTSQYLKDFDAVTAALGPADGSSGLLAQAERSVPPRTSRLTGPGSPYSDYLKAHLAVVGAANSGQFSQAVELATGTAPGDQLPAASQLSRDLSSRIDGAQSAFDAKAGAAAHDLSLLNLGVIGLVILAAVSALVGLQQRINEYR